MSKVYCQYCFDLWQGKDDVRKRVLYVTDQMEMPMIGCSTLS